MTDEDFLATILANPDDDGPRLVYADWLADRGDPRGEFIQLQCQIAECSPYDSRRRELEAREGDLWEEHGREWREPLRDLAGRVEFRRGFVEHVSMPLGRFVERGEELFDLAPVRSVKLREDKDWVPYLAECDLLLRLRRLSLNSVQMGAARSAVFFSSPHLHRLEELDIGNNALRIRGFEALLEARLDSLVRLDTNGNLVDDELLIRLLEWPRIRQLEHLSLGTSRFGMEGATAIADAGLDLRTLDVHWNRRLTSEGIQRIAVGGLPSLERWNLAYTHCDTVAVNAIANADFACTLRELELAQNRRVDAEAVGLLAEAPFDALEFLGLEGCPIGDDGADSLCEARWAETIRRVRVSRRGLSPDRYERLLWTFGDRLQVE